jgi:hypothetical protein
MEVLAVAAAVVAANQNLSRTLATSPRLPPGRKVSDFQHALDQWFALAFNYRCKADH